MATPDTDDEGFASWFEEGSPIPVMHPLPWVYAEVYFRTPAKIEWRVYDYKTDNYTIETFALEDEEGGRMDDE